MAVDPIVPDIKTEEPITAPEPTVPTEEVAPVAQQKVLSVVESTVGVPGKTPGDPGVIVGYSFSMS